MVKTIICNHCGKNVGKFWSKLDEHLWNEHRDIISKWLVKHGKQVQSSASTE